VVSRKNRRRERRIGGRRRRRRRWRKRSRGRAEGGRLRRCGKEGGQLVVLLPLLFLPPSAATHPFLFR
jgi:hypothetical protein